MIARIRSSARRLDHAAYQALAQTTTPMLDERVAALSRMADLSKLWIGCAGILAASGGRRGRAAAVTGLAGIGVTSTVVNLGLKPLARRRRPDRDGRQVRAERHVPMPESTSFPSGHAASAFAFASAAGRVLPGACVPLHALATLVAYSRVHTGVHYPGDVLAGSAAGVLGGRLTARHLRQRRS